VIHDEPVATLGEEAIAYRTMTNSLRAARVIPCDATPFSAAISPHIDESDEAIVRDLEELPLSSVRQLSRATHLPKTTVYRRLSEKLGFTARHLRCVPHILSDDQTIIPVQRSKPLLTMLRRQETRDWHEILILDESWFYDLREHEPIWPSPHGKVPDRERVAIQSRKVMFAIVCDPTGFAAVTALDSGCTFNAGDYASQMLTPFSE
jgi:hypothetical protein